MTRLLSALVLGVGVLSVSAPAFAELPVVETEPFQLRLGAYVSNFSTYSHLDYDTAGLIEEETATNAALVRLEWNAQFFSDLTLEVHNRFFWTATTGANAGGGLGLGSSIPPSRSVDLESEILDAEGLRLVHDIDRLALTYFTDVGDFTIGRQAISWGVSNLFTVADIWTQFSPFELDTSQKRGVDAVRWIAYPAGDLELDVVVADRGGLDDGDFDNLSGGARLGWSRGMGDYYVGGAKSYDRLLGLMGGAVDLETVTARLELSLPYAIDDGQLTLPRATTGVDYYSEKFTIIGEYHFSGPGTTDPEDYANVMFLDPPTDVVRGERYFVGQHYAGFLVGYLPWPELAFNAVTIVNLTDPSAMIAPSISYTFSDNVTGSLGAYVGVGDKPQFELGLPPVIEIDSEFGLVGQVFFLQLSGFI